METREAILRQFPADDRQHADIIRIKGDASNRQYFRVSGPKGSCIACIDPAFRGNEPDTYPFLSVGNLLARNGVRVPGVIGTDSAEGLLLLEDCGDLMLQDEVEHAGTAAIGERYRQVVDILVSIQAIRPVTGAIPFSLSFDMEKLMFEFDFFISHALEGVLAGTIPPDGVAALRREFESIASLLVRPEHFVLNHRDFHSRNIMLHHDEPVVIDFQDARLGLPQYDIVSLLRDSYVRLDTPMVETLKEYHFRKLEAAGTISMAFDEYLRYFDLMAFQRNVKALGTFCYQVGVAGNRTFEPSIAPTVGFLPDYIEARPELAAAGRIMEPLIRRFTT